MNFDGTSVAYSYSKYFKKRSSLDCPRFNHVLLFELNSFVAIYGPTVIRKSCSLVGNVIACISVCMRVCVRTKPVTSLAKTEIQRL